MSTPRRRRPESGLPEFRELTELDPDNWRQYDDVITDSLWLLSNRDRSGAHKGDYHGNFVPQIPNQLLRRFTLPGELVIDCFSGSGTTAIEAQRLERRFLGVELVPEVAEAARLRVAQDRDEQQIQGDENILIGNSADPEVATLLRRRAGPGGAALLLMHPPYHDIVKFSDDPACLGNLPSVGAFLDAFMSVFNNMVPLLAPGRHAAVVIGDAYRAGEYIPLQMLLTNALLAGGDLLLKSVVVKNIINNRAKRQADNLWRYRALAGGFYIFKHEYIVLFQRAVQPTML